MQSFIIKDSETQGTFCYLDVHIMDTYMLIIWICVSLTVIKMIFLFCDNVTEWLIGNYLLKT
jgi:hypothetical protein